MNDLYHQAISLIVQWPGIGPLASHRMLEFFLNDCKKKHSVHKLDTILSSFTQCTRCFLFIAQHTSCSNCAKKNSSQVILLPNPIDYFVCTTHKFFDNYKFFALNGYVSPHQGKTMSTTYLDDLIEHFCKSSALQINLMFNQTLEARATTWLIQKHLGKLHEINDISALLAEKESFYCLTLYEREHYIQNLTNFLPAP